MDEHDTIAWKGVPFAQPPLGRLRWKAPRWPRPWSDVRPATQDPQPCSQLESLPSFLSLPNVIGDEDCLYLNVWRPASGGPGAALPVYVWIHGGANVTGAAELYPGAALAQQANAVVVVVQYRLGPLGWFSHPALRQAGSRLDVSGNYGTLDLIQALRWVRWNIHRFGGDWRNVTIAGESAGAHNVSSMMISPLAAGLFHKAVHQSGGMRAQDVATIDASANGVIDSLLVSQGVAADPEEAAAIRESWNNNRIRRFLRAQDAGDLIIAQSPLGAPPPGAIIKDGRVIPSSFICAIESGNYNRVPILLGTNEEEFKLFLPLFPSFFSGMPDYTLLSRVLQDPTFSLDDALPTLAEKLLFEGISLYGSRMWTATHGDANARALAAQQDGVFSYQFNWGGEGERADDHAFIYGATHALEIYFFQGQAGVPSPGDFFDVFGGFLPESLSGREALRDAMVGYLAKFMRDGTPGDGGLGLVNWQEWSNAAAGPKSLVLDADLTSASQVVSTDSRTISDVRMEIEALDPVTQQLTLLYLSLLQPFSLWEFGDFDASQDCS